MSPTRNHSRGNNDEPTDEYTQSFENNVSEGRDQNEYDSSDSDDKTQPQYW
jgi:hypothetical protein